MHRLKNWRVVFWTDRVAISASHRRRLNLLFRKIQHAVLGDEVIAVDCSTLCQLRSQDGGAGSGRHTVPAAHASLARESGSAVQYTPVVKDYVVCLIRSSSIAGVLTKIEYIRSILPGLSWNQYTLSGWLRRASNLLIEINQYGASLFVKGLMLTYVAASYQRSTLGPMGACTPARSAVFQRTWVRPPSSVEWFKTG